MASATPETTKVSTAFACKRVRRPASRLNTSDPAIASHWVRPRGIRAFLTLLRDIFCTPSYIDELYECAGTAGGAASPQPSPSAMEREPERPHHSPTPSRRSFLKKPYPCERFPRPYGILGSCLRLLRWPGNSNPCFSGD